MVWCMHRVPMVSQMHVNVPNQIADYLVNKMEWTSNKTMCLEPPYIDSSLLFYPCIMVNWGDFLNPILECLHFPPLPGGSLFTLKRLGGVDPQRRELSLVGGIGGGLIGQNLLSEEAQLLINATEQIREQLSTCDLEVCAAVEEAVGHLGGWLDDVITTVFAVLNIVGCLFFATANLGFASYDSLLTFPQERALYNRETANGLYRSSAYYIAKNVSDLPFQLLPALTLSTIYYWMVGLGPSAAQFFVYFAVCAAITFAAYGFGYFISAVSPRMEVAVLIAPLTLVVWLVLSGFFLRDADIPGWIGWFKYLSFYRWGFFALTLNEFPPDGYTGSLPNESHLALAGITNDNISLCASMLIVLGLGFRILGFGALKFMNRRVGLES
eukprot:Polyplicarium_translucidae@DN3204_c0_g1_i1.p1